MTECKIQGCVSPARTREMCHRHYRRWHLYGDPEAPSRRGLEGGLSRQQTCAFAGCEHVGKVTKGYCPLHYARLLRHGDVSVVMPSGNVGKGRVRHVLYRSWSQMINRCHNPNNTSFGRYGARGIVVCDRWREDFHNFLADMGERPDGMTLDRINPDGNYEPGNCRWADAKTQRANHSPDGEKSMRDGIAAAKTEYWKRWRVARGLPAEAPSKAEYKARYKGRGQVAG